MNAERRAGGDEDFRVGVVARARCRESACAAIAWRRVGSPRLSGYRVRPALIAAAAASTMWAGVAKSGSPRINEMTVRPRAWTCRMSARIELTAVGLSSAARRERWRVVSRTPVYCKVEFLELFHFVKQPLRI